MTSSSSRNIEAAERERCRREAQAGACPVCGRTEAVDLERQVQSYAASVARLQSMPPSSREG